jgi:hypothetical protein
MNTKLSQESHSDFEEIFARCNYYSFSLLELAKQLQRLLSVLKEMQVEIDGRPAKRSWAEMWHSWWQTDWRSERSRLAASGFLSFSMGARY